MTGLLWHRGRWALAAAIGCLSVTACSNYVARGRSLYREGRYIESAELLAVHEVDLREQSPRKLAEYATYRGLSNLVLGNYPEAHRWMTYAYQIERGYPGALRADQRLELDQGWWELTMRMGPHPAGSPPSADTAQVGR